MRGAVHRRLNPRQGMGLGKASQVDSQAFAAAAIQLAYLFLELVVK